ncbi:MAG: hypothetical protein V2I66_13110 [Halieaceae bacterium]|nr:hypothetical protein [Halieaceae bacterium]
MAHSEKLNSTTERFPSKVSASFNGASEAHRAADRLLQAEDVVREQVVVIAPEDGAVDSKLQPEARAIEGTFFRKHIAFGLSGLAAGLVLATVAISWGPDVFTGSPFLSTIAITWVTFLSSLMVAGALTLRMDHDMVTNHALRAADEGKYLVVAHARSGAEKRRFAEELKPEATATASTL